VLYPHHQQNPFQVAPVMHQSAWAVNGYGDATDPAAPDPNQIQQQQAAQTTDWENSLAASGAKILEIMGGGQLLGGSLGITTATRSSASSVARSRATS
jgi:hypothetical protein